MQKIPLHPKQNPPTAGGGATTPRQTAGRPSSQRRRSRNTSKVDKVDTVIPKVVTLTINTNAPNTTITLDGKPSGTTKPDGPLTLPAMLPQTYKLIARATGYFDKEYPIDLTSGGDKSIKIDLAPKPGTLTIMSVSGAKISISNVGSYTTQVENLPIEARDYTVEASKPGYESATSTINVPPAGTANRAIPLKPLPPEKALAEADQHFQNNEYDIALDIGETVLKTQPDNPRANVLVGSSHYRSGRFCQSLPYLLKALEGNEQIEIPIKINPEKAPGDSLIEGRLVLHRGDVSFKPSEGQVITFSIGAHNIQKLKVEEQKGGRIYISFSLPFGADNKWKTTEIYFHPAKANVTSGPKRTVECDGCQQELQTILLLIQAVQ